MSLSPVKPPLNPTNLAVPTAPTNLTKTPLPSANNYTPLNLMPEKPIAPVTIVSTVEKSIDLCSKPSQQALTSNGTVFPVPESNQNAVLSNVQNCVDNCEMAENLSTTNLTSKPEISQIESPKINNDVEEKKIEIKKASPSITENSANVKVPEKDASVHIAGAKDAVIAVENIPAQVEEKKESVVDSSAGSIHNDVAVMSTKKEQETNKLDSKLEPSPKKESASSTSSKMSVPSTTDVADITRESEVKLSVESEKTNTSNETKPETPAKSTPKATKRKAKSPAEVVEEDSSDGRKSKRTRLPTQPYQSPIPELQLIAKLNTPIKATPKDPSEKIIAFYKNEFLAVRNPEGSFYICQAFQNIYRSSSKIKIRWFTNLPQNIYTPDFYDKTEFDCILTNVTMVRVEKDRWKLPDHELTRIENILKRALDVEKGVAEQPSVTEEHPDGLDLSLYRDEAQLQKKNRKKVVSPKKIKSPPEEKKKTFAKEAKKPSKAAEKSIANSTGTKKSTRLSSPQQPTATKETVDTKVKVVEKAAAVAKEKKDKKKKKAKVSKKTILKLSEKTNSKTWEPSVKASNSSRVVLSLRKEETSAKISPVVAESKATKRTSSVSLKASAAAATAEAPPPSKRRKDEGKSPSSNQAASSDRPGKVRNAGSAVAAKINSAAMRTTKDKERKTSSSSSQRKK